MYNMICTSRKYRYVRHFVTLVQYPCNKLMKINDNFYYVLINSYTLSFLIHSKNFTNQLIKSWKYWKIRKSALGKKNKIFLLNFFFQSIVFQWMLIRVKTWIRTSFSVNLSMMLIFSGDLHSLTLHKYQIYVN